MANQNVTLLDEHICWLDERVASGDFASISDVIQALIEEKTQSVMTIEALRSALKAGEASGYSDKDPHEFLAELKAKYI